MGFSNELSVIILAAGKGKRIKSETPKVLHRICGQPLIYHILKQVVSLSPKNIFAVIGHKKQEVREYLKSSFPIVQTVDQDYQAGTAHAVMMTRNYFTDMGKNILILSGDSPLITADTLRSLIDLRVGKGLAVSILTSVADDPTGYGRIIRDSKGRISKIVEEADASPPERKINEVNSSIYCFERDVLLENIENIGTDNSQREHY